MSASREREPRSVRLYRGLLRRVPGRAARVAAPELVQVFRDEHREVRARSGRAGVALLWMRALWDLAWFAWREGGRTAGPRPGVSEGLAATWAEVRYAARALGRSPGFTALAVGILSVGIGGNAAIFAVVDATFLEAPPHVAEPERLVRVNRTSAGRSFGALAYPDYAWYRDEASSFDGLAAYDPDGVAVSLGAGDAPVSGRAWLVSGNYFQVLGVRPAAGRWFAEDEDRPGGTPSVAVLSHGLWTRAFGAEPGVVGSTVTLNGRPFTVVGVAPAGFQGISPVEAPPDLWVPIHAQPILGPAGGPWALERVPDNRWFWLWSVGRLAEGATVEAAGEEMSALAAHLAEAYPEWNEGLGVVVSPGARFHPPTGSDLAALLRLLSAVVAAALLVACVNVAIMLMARGARRRREVGVRVALGAGRARVVRGALVETLLLWAAGGVLGTLLAGWAARGLSALAPAEFAVGAAPDVRVLAFSLAVAGVTGLAFGTLPALRSARLDPAAVLRGEAGGVGSGRTRRTLVVAQVALSVMLVAGAGLFARSLATARGVEIGFATGDRAVLGVNLRNHGYDEEAGRAFVREALERIRAVPGVRSAASTRMLPFRGRWSITAPAPGAPAGGSDPGDEVEVGVNAVSPGYFETLDIPVLAGRGFEPGDDGAGGRHAVVINRELAERFWPGEDAVGRLWDMGDDGPGPTVVGVVENARYYELGEPPRTQVYMPVLDVYVPSVLFVAHVEGGAATVAAVREALRGLDAGLAFTMETSMEEALDGQIGRYRTLAAAVGVVGLLALGLASAGLYAVLAFGVAGRTREIGVRVALGASTAGVARRVVAEGVGMALVGIVLGLIGVALGTDLVRGMLFGVGPRDPVTLIAAPLLLLAVAAAAALAPALRAARVDPVESLRAD